MSQPLGWTPKPGASSGTASWVSSKRDAQSFSHHTGTTSLFIYWFSLMDSHFTHQDVWSQNVLALHRGQQSNQTVHKMSRRYCNYNWLELHFSCKVLFPAWQLILAGRNTLAAIKLSCSMRAYWLTFFSLYEKRNCQYRCWSLFIIQDFLEQS